MFTENQKIKQIAPGQINYHITSLHTTFEYLTFLSRCRRALSSRTRLLVLNQVLLIGELGVTQAQRERDERNTKTDTSDGKQALNMLVRINHGIPLVRTNREVENGRQRLRVGVHCESLVSEAGE